MANTVFEEFVDLILKPGKTDTGALTKAQKELMEDVRQLFASKDETVALKLKMDISGFKDDIEKKREEIKASIDKLRIAAKAGALPKYVSEKKTKEMYGRREAELDNHLKVMAPLMDRLETLSSATSPWARTRGARRCTRRL